MLRISNARVIRFALLIVWAACLMYLSLPDPQGTDFYPFYKGLRSLLSSENPYSVEIHDFLQRTWEIARSRSVAAVVAYPVPALLPFLPLGMMPLEVASSLWLCIIVTAIGASILFSQNSIPRSLSILLFYPLIHAAILKNTSALWFAIALVVTSQSWKSSGALQSFLVSLLATKPQAGLFFAAYESVRAFRQEKTLFVSILVATVILFGLSIIIFPTWPLYWFQLVTSTYLKDAVTVFSIPLLIIGAALTWRLHPLIFISFIQFAAFPMNDIYSSLPLLIAWQHIDARLALAASALSLSGAVFMAEPNSSTYLVYCIVLPFLLIAILAQLAKFERYSRLSWILAKGDCPITDEL